MATATAESLSPAAREFVDSGPKRLLIGGEHTEAADGKTFETIDPATGDVICEIALGAAEDAARAAEAAREALDGPLRKINAAKRSGLMNALAELIKANGAELAELESLDNGKPLAAAKGDMAATVNHLRYYAGWPTKIEGETIPVSARDVLCYTVREPVGVCAQIVPWNFPLLMAMWKVAPALAAGCAIVLKPAEQTPLTALRLGELALEAGFPEGTLNVLTGDGAHRRRARRRARRRQGRLHRLDRGRPRDRRQVRPLPEARHPRAGRQEPEHHPPGRRPGPRDQGLLRGHLLQLRPGLQRRLPPLRPARPVRRGHRAPRRLRPRGQGRPGPRPRHPARPARLSRAVRPRQGLHRLGRRGGRRARRGRFARRQRRAATS